MTFDAQFSADPELRIPRAEERLCLLQNSAAVANIFIRIAGRKAQALEAGEETEGGQEALAVFVRASRILHASVALQPKVEKELASLRAGDPLLETAPRRAPRADPSDPIWAPSEEDLSTIDPREIIRGNVLEIINPDSYDEDGREWIYEELDERLYESERYNEFLDLPMEDLVELICKDLGVKPDWERWDGYEWPPWRTDKTRTKPASCPPVARQGDDVLRTLSVPAGPAPNIPDDPYPDSG
jgi:hypothetical protein